MYRRALLNFWKILPALFPIRDPRIRQGMDEAVRDSLMPVAFGMGLFFVVISISHLFFLPPPARLPMFGLGAATTVLFFALSGYFKRHPVDSRLAHPVGAGMAGLALLNLFAHMYYVPQPQLTINIMFLQMAVGYFFLSPFWLAVVLLSSLGGWGLLASQAPPSPDWIHFALDEFIALMLAVLIQAVRIHAYGRIYRNHEQQKEQNGALEAALISARQSDEQFRSAFDYAPIGVALVGLKGNWLKVNRSLCQIVGYSEEEFLATDFQTLTHPEDLETDLAYVQQMIEGLRDSYQLEKRYFHKEGRIVWVMLNVSMIRDVKGDPLYFIAQIQDVTEQKQNLTDLTEARDAALEAARLKAEFLANISHEIRTPLNGVLGMADMLLETELAPEQREYAKTIHESGESLLAVLNDILDFSKTESGRISLASHPFDIVDLVEETAQSVAYSIISKNLKLVPRIDFEEPRGFKGDSERIRQVLLHLLGNALKFTERGEIRLRVSLLRRTESVAVLRFAVSDTGIGVPPEQQGRIFQPFVQVDGSSTRRYGGTGLGLALSKKLIEQMQGEIGMSSTSGVGSTFWFSMPLEVAAPSPDATEETAPEPRRKILVVESDRLAQKVVLRQLRRLGFDANVVETQQEALEALRRVDYSTVLLDEQSSEIDIYSTTRAIRQLDDPVRHIPLIAMTSHPLHEEHEHRWAAGIDGCLSKPLQLADLNEALQRPLPEAFTRHAVDKKESQRIRLTEFSPVSHEGETAAS